MLEQQFTRVRKNITVVPDWGEPFKDSNIPQDYDVLLMGKYFERLFQLDYWPDTEFNLFCLSSQIRNILINVFSVESEIIGCLSRYELFPIEKKIIKPFYLTKKTHFFFSGRLSAQKNIEFLIFTIFYLQIFYSSEIKLTLIGNFDNEYHHDLLGFHYMDYSSKITKLLSELPWTGCQPDIISGLDEHNWTPKIPDEGIFLSTSNLLSEDFSVTSAQLQQLGIPQLVPFWGGFKDVIGEDICHYPETYIAHSHLNLHEINVKAKNFAQIIASGNLFLPHEKKPSKAISILPKYKIDKSYLSSCIEKNKRKWGNEIVHLTNEDFPTFALSKTGQDLILECRKQLSSYP